MLGLVLCETADEQGFKGAYRVWFWESGHTTVRSAEFWEYNYRVVVGDEQ